MEQVISVSKKIITDDLESISKKHGHKFIIAMLATIIFDHYWFVWPSMKESIIKEAGK